MRNVKTSTKKHIYHLPIYFDYALYKHDHIENYEKQKKFVASIKRHVSKNHLDKEIFVEVNGVFEVLHPLKTYS